MKSCLVSMSFLQVAVWRAQAWVKAGSACWPMTLTLKRQLGYAANWGAADLRVGDVGALNVAELPGHADLAWASFPCQDLSLAGAGAGLNGSRSGSFWGFWRLVRGLGEAGRSPRLVVLENACGALTSHQGQDFAALANALVDAGYRFGAVVVNAVHFLPQSRPRLFIIGVLNQQAIPEQLITTGPEAEWHPPALVDAYGKLSPSTPGLGLVALAYS